MSTRRGAATSIGRRSTFLPPARGDAKRYAKSLRPGRPTSTIQIVALGVPTALLAWGLLVVSWAVITR
jgi:hypothetical protein